MGFHFSSEPKCCLAERHGGLLESERPDFWLSESEELRVNSGLQGRAICGRGHAYDATKHLSEVTLVCKAAAYSSLKDSDRRIVQQNTRTIDSSSQDSD